MARKEFNVPKLFNLNTDSSKNNNPLSHSDMPGKEFTVPNIFHTDLKERNSQTKNFFIPKLTSTNCKMNLNESNLDELDSKKDSGDEFTSLSDLVSNHLNSTPVKCKMDFSNHKRTYGKETDLNKSVSKMAKLQLSDAKSIRPVADNSPVTNGWHIDLSIALKSTNSLPSVSKGSQKDNLEKFDIPFVECDGQRMLPNKKLLPCKFDINSILLVPLKYQKYSSSFGKALCLRYKRRKSNIKTFYNDSVDLSKIKRFDFKIPSPDDIISSHLRR